MSESLKNQPQERRASDEWELQATVSPKIVGILLIVTILLGWSAHNTEMDKAAIETAEMAISITGYGESQALDGAVRFLKKAFPFKLESRQETNRIENFAPDDLPLFSRVEVVEEREYDTMTDTFTMVKSEYLVEPFGYLLKVLGKMRETIEMAFWGSILAVVISVPLGILSSKNYTPHIIIYSLARTQLAFHRAMPELIVALFFVLMYGFGPIAGVLALAMHTSGVLGKFFADEIENAPPGPQGAIMSTGASHIKVLRFAVLPHVFPQYVAYVQYIFERNIRTATVLGIVGAGGIGMELKGRWDLFDYSHVSTIMLLIFITVVTLEMLSQKLRTKAI